LVFATEFALTPNNIRVFARADAGRVSVRQGNAFAFEGDDAIDFEDEDQNPNFFFPKDYAWAVADSANPISVLRRFYSDRGKDYLLVGVPYSWITSSPAGTLIIDPTVKAAASEDTWLESTGINGNSTQFLIGKTSGNNKKRTLIKFDLSGVPANATVLNAQMKLYYFNTGGSGWVDRWVQAHQVLVNWNEAQATKDYRLTSTDWNVDWVGLNDIDANDTFESTLLFYLDGGGQQIYGWKTWDLSALTQKWVNSYPVTPNYGVVLWATNETADAKDLRFYSSEYSDTTKTPRMYVTFSQQVKTVYFLKDHLGSPELSGRDGAGQHGRTGSRLR
jgi:hypothetical protein